LTAWADGCIVSISSLARVVAVWPGIVYAGAKGMLTFCAHDSSASTCDKYIRVDIGSFYSFYDQPNLCSELHELELDQSSIIYNQLEAGFI
jgi:hypothetical protein